MSANTVTRNSRVLCDLQDSCHILRVRSDKRLMQGKSPKEMEADNHFPLPSDGVPPKQEGCFLG